MNSTWNTWNDTGLSEWGNDDDGIPECQLSDSVLFHGLTHAWEWHGYEEAVSGPDYPLVPGPRRDPRTRGNIRAWPVDGPSQPEEVLNHAVNRKETLRLPR